MDEQTYKCIKKETQKAIREQKMPISTPDLTDWDDALSEVIE